jgi:hypothetical protein
LRVESLTRETILTLVLGGVAIHFSILTVRGVSIYLKFLKVRPTALLTWPVRPRWNVQLLALGVVAAGVAVLNGYAHRPIHQIYSQGIMAAYFILMVPLLTRIHPGLYQDGVWAERGFLPYGKIGRMAFREFPEIVLVLVPRGGRGSFRLPVPPAEYGAVRKVLEDKIRAKVLNVDAGILGLQDRPSV